MKPFAYWRNRIRGERYWDWFDRARHFDPKEEQSVNNRADSFIPDLEPPSKLDVEGARLLRALDRTR